METSNDGDVVSESAQRKLSELRRLLQEMPSALVCYSGGVDSAFLLKVAHDALGTSLHALTAVSPSLAIRELALAKGLALDLGVQHILVETNELSREGYRDNPPDRCYFCKTELMVAASAEAKRLGYDNILIGTNADDVQGHRPGMKATQEYGAKHPMVEVGLTKAEIRSLSKSLGLPTWNRPQMACLSSRFPYGTKISRERLGRVERFEDGLVALGFEGSRVRFHDQVARIEVPVEQLQRVVAPEVREALIVLGKELGFSYVTLDLAGYRTGSLNEVLPQKGQ